MEGLMSAASGTATYLETTLHESWVNTKIAIDDLSKSTNPLIQIMGDVVKSAGGAFAEHEKITKVGDFVKFPDETVEPLPVDTIVGLTQGKQAFQNLNSTNSGGPSMSTSNIKMEDVKINLSIDITGTDKMNPEDLKTLFETNQTLKQSIVANVLKGLNEGANGSNGSNPIEARKQMDKLSNIAFA